MTELIIASGNRGKIKEIKEILPGINILSLADIGFDGDIPEPYDTFEQNAFIKADTIYKYTSKNVFADDSGICVDALGGAPGVFSARYAGEKATDEANLNLLMHYTAVICLIWNGKTYYFEGICNGSLLDEPRGTGGFGYDPIFVPESYDQTFAELPPEIKNNISHRGKAIRQMTEFLKEQQ
jgi:XTP/dITP diphosphohydrolase